MPVHALAVSDEIDQRIYSATLRQRMPDVEVVFSCGDLPARYLEFIVDALDKPVYYVLGNHAEELTRGGDWGWVRGRRTAAKAAALPSCRDGSVSSARWQSTARSRGTPRCK